MKGGGSAKQPKLNAWTKKITQNKPSLTSQARCKKFMEGKCKATTTNHCANSTSNTVVKKMHMARGTASWKKAQDGVDEWTCQFCNKKFDVKATDNDDDNNNNNIYATIKEHEMTCEVGSIVEIPYKSDGKKLGLVPINYVDKHHEKLRPMYVALSKNSPVFLFANNTRAATNALFGLDAWSVKSSSNNGAGSGIKQTDVDSTNPNKLISNDIINAMVEFGKANLPNCMKVVVKNAPVNASDINSEVLKQAIIGQIRPGDSVRKILYTEGSKIIDRIVQTVGGPEGAQDLCYILKLERYYPVQLTLKRKIKPTLSASSSSHTAANNSILHTNPLMDLSKITLNKNLLVSSNMYWDGLSNGLKLLVNLKELHLNDNGIGRDGCRHLSELLKRENSPLKHLSLRQNGIDDECVSILVKALESNTALETLDLYNNGGVTNVGWDYVSNLICDKSSINSTHLSNHMLKSLGVADFAVQGSPPSPSEPASVTAMLQINKTATSTKRAAKEKVWQVYFQTNNDPFDLQPLLDVDVKIMPHVLAYFAKHQASQDAFPSEGIRMRKLYHVLHDWNVEALFGYPSAESLRIGSREKVLERKNTDLEALVKKLQAENDMLMREKGMNEGSSDANATSSPTSGGPSPTHQSKKRKVSPNK